MFEYHKRQLEKDFILCPATCSVMLSWCVVVRMILLYLLHFDVCCCINLHINEEKQTPSSIFFKIHLISIATSFE